MKNDDILYNISELLDMSIVGKIANLISRSSISYHLPTQDDDGCVTAVGNDEARQKKQTISTSRARQQRADTQFNASNNNNI